MIICATYAKWCVLKKPLPLEPPFDTMWLKITKLIDRLHLCNHKNKLCQEIYSPEPLKEKYLNLNTPFTEQVFTWSARFKKILCAMPQERFLFYYHRMVVRRNRYTANVTVSHAILFYLRSGHSSLRDLFNKR